MSLTASLRRALAWIDRIPLEAQLPTMPGFDRDWAESQLAPSASDAERAEALKCVLEWIKAVPAEISANLPPLDGAAPLAKEGYALQRAQPDVAVEQQDELE